MRTELSVPDDIKEFIKWLPSSDYHTREKAFVQFSSRGVEAYIAMGAILCMARDKEDWAKAQCQNMKEYCEGEMRISYTQAIRMMTIWDKLHPYIVDHYGVMKQISFVNLYEVARVAALMDSAKVVELMRQAAVDTERGFKDNIRSIEGKVAHDECDHVNADKYLFKCRTCGKIMPIERETLKERLADEEQEEWKKMRLAYGN